MERISSEYQSQDEETDQSTALMMFIEKLKDTRGVESFTVEETVREVKTEEILSEVRKAAKNLPRMDRSQLLGFIKTMFHLRDSFYEKDIQSGVGATEVTRELLILTQDFISLSRKL